MSEHDWSQFKLKIDIKANPSTIFDYWTKQENIEKWFLSLAEFHDDHGSAISPNHRISPSNKYKWMWHGSDIVAEGEVVEIREGDYVKFTFVGCMVEVFIKNEENTTLIELIQSEIGLDDTSRKNNYVGCTRGWTFYMANLKSILEGGIDLRNKNILLKDMLNT